MKYLVNDIESEYNLDEGVEFEDLQSAQIAAVDKSWDDRAYGVYEWRGENKGWILEAIVFGSRVFS